MTQDETARGSRQDRLKLALRENLRRRKGQVRARSGTADAAAASPAEDEAPEPDHREDRAKPAT